MSIKGFLNNLGFDCHDRINTIIEGCKQMGKEIVSFDRSCQLFILDLNDKIQKLNISCTPNPLHLNANQLKGRSREVKIATLISSLAGVMFLLFLTQALFHGGIGNWFIMGAGDFAGGVALKEAILQSYARHQEQKKSRIEESDETRYTFRDLGNEISDSLFRFFKKRAI